MELIVRPATQGDIDELNALCQSTIELINSQHYDARQIAAWRGRLNVERWQELFAGDLHFFAACAPDGQIVGVASVNAQGYLHSMFTHHLYQRQGVVRALLACVEREARSMGATILRSDVSLTALPFFMSMGFSKVEEQIVAVNGVKMINFALCKHLS